MLHTGNKVVCIDTTQTGMTFYAVARRVLGTLSLVPLVYVFHEGEIGGTSPRSELARDLSAAHAVILIGVGLHSPVDVAAEVRAAWSAGNPVFQYRLLPNSAERKTEVSDFGAIQPVVSAEEFEQHVKQSLSALMDSSPET